MGSNPTPSAIVRRLGHVTADDFEAWSTLKSRQIAGELVQASTVAASDGGLVVEVDGLQWFLPISRIVGLSASGVEPGDLAAVRRALRRESARLSRLRSSGLPAQARNARPARRR